MPQKKELRMRCGEARRKRQRLNGEVRELDHVFIMLS